MLRAAGDDPALVQPAFDAFFAARCEVEHYDDSLDALDRLAARVPLAALSNGNADLERIGLMHVFAFQLGAREHGAAKPAASIFHAACAQLGCEPAQVLHVGDDIELELEPHDPAPGEPDLGLFDTLGSILRELDPEGIPVPFLQPGVTDARFFSPLGIQTYGFLPLRLSAGFAFTPLVHAADERVPVDALEFGAEAVWRALQRFA